MRHIRSSLKNIIEGVFILSSLFWRAEYSSRPGVISSTLSQVGDGGNSGIDIAFWGKNLDFIKGMDEE